MTKKVLEFNFSIAVATEIAKHNSETFPNLIPKLYMLIRFYYGRMLST